MQHITDEAVPSSLLVWQTQHAADNKSTESNRFPPTRPAISPLPAGSRGGRSSRIHCLVGAPTRPTGTWSGRRENCCGVGIVSQYHYPVSARTLHISLEYPSSVRWQHFLSPSLPPGCNIKARRLSVRIYPASLRNSYTGAMWSERICSRFAPTVKVRFVDNQTFKSLGELRDQIFYSVTSDWHIHHGEKEITRVSKGRQMDSTTGTMTRRWPPRAQRFLQSGQCECD